MSFLATRFILKRFRSRIFFRVMTGINAKDHRVAQKRVTFPLGMWLVISVSRLVVHFELSYLC